ncbi:MAG: hypothetical protein ACOCSL_05345, partial [Thermoplasmatota archaeon]
YTNGVPLMLDKETVSKMRLYKINDDNIEVNLLVCIKRAEDLIDEGDPLKECFSKIKDITE